MGLRVNFADVEDYDPIPSGNYHLKVTDGELRDSGENAKHPDSQYINWELTVQKGEFEGRKVWTNTVFDHAECTCDEGDKFMKGLFALMGLLGATGKWSKEELKDDEFDFEIDDVIGLDVKAAVTKTGSEDDEYGVQNNVKRFRRISEAEMAETSLLP